MRISSIKNKSSLGRKIACIFLCFVMVVTFTPFSMQAVFADTNEKEEIVQEGNNIADNWGTHAYWLSKYPSMQKLTTQTTANKTLSTGVYYVAENETVYFNSDSSAPTTANYSGNGLQISGNVTIVMENGSSLYAIGSNGSGTTAGYAGIYLPSDATLYMTGVGNVTAKGGNAAPGANGDSGGTGTGNSDTYYTGAGGNGGNGGGGAGAAVGTNGGTGGATASGGAAIKCSTGGSGTSGNSNGANGSYGNSGNSSSVPGAFKSSGKISFSLTAGSVASNSRSAASKGSHKDFSGGYHHWSGAGGGGGGGGYGAPGASIGSGGSGGASGGGGGSGGCEYDTFGADNWYDNAGGGGGGAGYLGGMGGLAETDKGGQAFAATSGKDASSPSTSGGLRGFGGGKSQVTLSNGNEANGETNSGGRGGDGGGTSNSATPSIPVYTTTLSASSASGASLVGQNAQRYKVYPYDECKVEITTTPTSFDGTCFKYTGSSIKPAIKVTHVPTNTQIFAGSATSGGYKVTYPSDTTNYGSKTITVKSNYTSVSSGETLVGADGNMNSVYTGDGLSVTYKIKVGVKISIPQSVTLDKTYDGTAAIKPSDKDGTNTLEVTEELSGEPATGHGTLLYQWEKLDSPNQGQKTTAAPSNAGKYKLTIKTDPETDVRYTGQLTSPSSFFTVLNDTVGTQFEITKTDLTVSAPEEGLSYTKTFDNTTTLPTMTGTPVIEGIPETDESKVEVQFNYPTAYDDANVKNQTKNVSWELVAKSSTYQNLLNNYNLIKDPKTGEQTVPVKYEITPREISIASATAQARAFTDLADKSVTINSVTFNDTKTTMTKDTDYFVSDAMISDGDATAGEHQVTFNVQLPNSSNYIFSDDEHMVTGETTVTISPATISKPTASGTTFTYTENNGVPVQQTYDVESGTGYTVVEGTNVGTEAGNYTAKYTLNDTTNTTWEGGTVDDAEIDWTIQKAAPYSFNSKVVYYDPIEAGTKTFKVDESQMPTGMKAETTYAAGEVEGEGAEFIKNFSVDNEGNATFDFAPTSTGEGKIATIPVLINSKNYSTSAYYIDVIQSSRTQVQMSGKIEVGKEYDGTAVTPNLSNFDIVDPNTGESIKTAVSQYLKFIYWKGDEQLTTPPKDAGEYSMTVVLDVNNQDYRYVGNFSLDFAITPKPLTVSAGTCYVEKPYDGNTLVPTSAIKGELEIDTSEIVGSDEVNAMLHAPGYFSKDVQQTKRKVRVVLTGASAANYTVNTKVKVPYIITPREITFKGATAVDRGYVPGNFNVTMQNPVFENEVTGQALQPGIDYTLSDGRIPNDVPGKYKASYTINLTNGNYIFNTGSKSITTTAPVTISGMTLRTDLPLLPTMWFGKAI